MKLESLQDVVDQILPLAPEMTEKDISDLIYTIHLDPSSGPEILAAYQAANPPKPLNVRGLIWQILLDASSVASIITSIVGAVELI